MKKLALLIAGGALTAGLGPGLAQTPQFRPVLHFTGHEHYSTPQGNWVRYRFDVTNKADFPAQLFAPAPNLPPCGTNTNSSRTWVDFFNQNGQRLYGFCALNSPQHLGSIWFAWPDDQDPPARVYIELNDRQTSTKYRSNSERIP